MKKHLVVLAGCHRSTSSKHLFFNRPQRDLRCHLTSTVPSGADLWSLTLLRHVIDQINLCRTAFAGRIFWAIGPSPSSLIARGVAATTPIQPAAPQQNSRFVNSRASDAKFQGAMGRQLISLLAKAAPTILYALAFRSEQSDREEWSKFVELSGELSSERCIFLPSRKFLASFRHDQHSFARCECSDAMASAAPINFPPSGSRNLECPP